MTRTTPQTAPRSPYSHEHASGHPMSGRPENDPQNPSQPLPWEAAYEPGNVSDYLVGHYATEQDARAAAEEWFRAQRLDPDEIGPLIWDDYGQLGEFYGGVETDTGLVVRRREMPADGEPDYCHAAVLLAIAGEGGDA